MEKLKLLFVTDELYPYLNANSEIVYRLAKVLRDIYSCSVSILGFNKESQVLFPEHPDHIHTIRIDTISKTRYIVNSNNKLVRWLKLVSKPACLRYLIKKRKSRDEALAREYDIAIKTAERKWNYDVIICFSEPFLPLTVLAKQKKRIPFIAYLLDPIPSSLGFIYRSISEKEKIEERVVDANASAIVVSNAFRNDYLLRGKEVEKKLYALDYPNVLDYRRDIFDQVFDNQNVHCVYAGRLYRDIRNPNYAFSLFSRLADSGVVLHVLGHEDDRAIEYELPRNVVYHGRVSNDIAIQYMNSADILVNIGNTLSNLFPSKILTYISLGKPILNFVKNLNCPTLKYMDIYPLALNVFETKDPTEKEIKSVRDFIFKNKEKNVSFDIIKRIYNSCTPEFVGGRVFDIVCSVLEKAKEKK